VFGVFFLPDPVRATADLWRLTRPGGQMAVTTWGPRLFEPANSMFWDAVDNVRPDLTRAYNPWDSLTEPDAVGALLTRAGVPACTVEAVDGRHELRSAEDFWTIVRGSGYRATHDALDEAGRDEVRAATLAAITRQNITSIETNVIFAVATKTDDRASTK
jgi:hypothetical protein